VIVRLQIAHQLGRGTHLGRASLNRFVRLTYILVAAGCAPHQSAGAAATAKGDVDAGPALCCNQNLARRTPRVVLRSGLAWSARRDGPYSHSDWDDAGRVRPRGKLEGLGGCS